MPTLLLSRSRIPSVSVRCETTANRLKQAFPLLTGKSAQQRNATIKENLNKLIAIATTDMKECYDLAVELDVAHKKALFPKGEHACDAKGTEENIFVDETQAKN